MYKAVSVEVDWIVDLQSSWVDIKFGDVGTIELKPDVELKNYNFVLKLVRATPGVKRHVFIISPEAAIGSTLPKVLPEIIACEKVERIELQLPNKETAVDLINGFMLLLLLLL